MNIETAISITENLDAPPDPTVYPFTSEELDRVITRESPGTYSLGRLDHQGHYVVAVVGRSDDDVNDELQGEHLLHWAVHLSLDVEFRYTHFTFRYTESAQEAFEHECLDYHAAYATLEDKKHPRRRDSAGRRCFCPSWQCAANY